MTLEGDLTALRGTVASLQQELGTELLSQLTEDEQVRDVTCTCLLSDVSACFCIAVKIFCVRRIIAKTCIERVAISYFKSTDRCPC